MIYVKYIRAMLGEWARGPNMRGFSWGTRENLAKNIIDHFTKIDAMENLGMLGYV